MESLQYLGGGKNYPCETGSDRSPSIRATLEEKKQRLTGQLAEVDKAIAALDANPEVANTLEMTMRAMRC